MDLSKAAEAITAAAKGIGMMNATVGEVMAALSGQKQVHTEDGQNLPPIFALAKSSTMDQAVREEQLSKALEDGVINGYRF